MFFSNLWIAFVIIQADFNGLFQLPAFIPKGCSVKLTWMAYYTDLTLLITSAKEVTIILFVNRITQKVTDRIWLHFQEMWEMAKSVTYCTYTQHNHNINHTCIELSVVTLVIAWGILPVSCCCCCCFFTSRSFVGKNSTASWLWLCDGLVTKWHQLHLWMSVPLRNTSKKYIWPFSDVDLWSVSSVASEVSYKMTPDGPLCQFCLEFFFI